MGLPYGHKKKQEINLTCPKDMEKKPFKQVVIGVDTKTKYHFNVDEAVEEAITSRLKWETYTKYRIISTSACKFKHDNEGLAIVVDLYR